MKKLFIIIGGIAACLVLFLGGYFVGTVTHKEVSREIRFGYQHESQENRVDYPHVFTNAENQTIVDNLMMMYIDKEKINTADVDVEHPDLYMSVANPEHSIILIMARIWFTNDGAIVGERRGENWEEVQFYRIAEGDVQYIKDLIGYEGFEKDTKEFSRKDIQVGMIVS